MTDDEIISALQSSDDQRRRQAMHALYTDPDLQKKAFHAVLDRKGDEDLARECFQFALLTVEEKIRLNLFNQKSSLHTYILGIIKWHLVNERRKSHLKVPYDADLHATEETSEDVDSNTAHSDRLSLLRKVIENMSERCKHLLLRWACNATPQELCVEFGFSNPEMARKETYRCRQRIRTYINQREWLKKALNPD